MTTPTETDLTTEQRSRYARHLLLPEVGLAGQRRLLRSRVLVIGAGGLGSPVLTYLAAAGVGTIGLVDDDTVDLTNLQRQVVHRTVDVGRLKTESAAERLAAINPGVRTVLHSVRLTAETVWDLLEGYDVVVDGTDNFATRYLLGDACALRGLPYVWAALFRFDAALSVFDATTGPCYRCVHPVPPAPGSVPSCAEGGVLGAMAGVVGAAQATEALKLLLGVGRPLVGRLATFDALDGEWRYVTVAKNPGCALCGPRATILSRADVADAWVEACSVDAPAPTAGHVRPVDLALYLSSRPGTVLLDVRSQDEAAIVSIPGSTLLPLPDLLDDPGVVAQDRPVVVVCRSGARSARAADALRAAGHPDVAELAGGVLRWVSDVAPDQPTY